MKKITMLSIALSSAMIMASSLCKGQANTSLSNLVAPTSVNVNLQPKNNSLNLGSSTKSWKRLYITDGMYKDTMRIFAVDSTNAAVGFNSLTINAGKYNTATGSQALRSNSTGALNTAIGAVALLYNTIGVGNTALGMDNMYSNINGNFNTASGYFALALNKSGSTNIANGDNALYSNTSGYSNVAVGSKALYKNTDGYNSVAVGDSALLNSSTGDENVAVGSKTLYNSTSGYWNTAIGFNTLYTNVSGTTNTGVGSHSLYNNVSGSSNTSVGYTSLSSNKTGSYNTAFGAYANVMSGNFLNATALGYSAYVDASNKIRLGNDMVTSIGGQVDWSVFSDGRYKKNIKENVPGLEFINALRPVTYTVDINGLNNYFRAGLQQDLSIANAIKKSDAVLKDSYDKATKIVHTGFIAQEVEAAANKLNYDFNGVDKPETKDKLYALRYAEFVVPLVKAVQELSKENEDIKQENQELKARLDKIESMLNANQTSLATKQQINAVAKLEQNQPNPTASSTTIKYFVPAQTSKAVISITNRNGQEIKSINLQAKNNGQVSVATNNLLNGSYFYSLIIDGKIADTKTMIIAH